MARQVQVSTRSKNDTVELTFLGKTYTMYGMEDQYTDKCEDPRNRGLIPRLLESIVRKCPPSKGKIYLSFLQIYNETLDDLLSDDHETEQDLEIKEDNQHGIYIKGIREFIIKTPDEAIWLLSRGEKIRAVRETTMNTNSSRSHLILQVRYESVEQEDSSVLVSFKPFRGHLKLF